MKRTNVGLSLASLFLAVSGCVVSSTHAGVSNRWRDENVRFEVGKTTQSEVLKRLGPPSQLIDLEDRLVFYYLLEHEDSQDAIFIVYNRSSVEIIYDRAIFFFDKNGVLTEQAVSHEALPYTAEESSK